MSICHTQRIRDVSYYRPLVYCSWVQQDLLFFEDEGAVDGEGEIGDGVEDVEDEHEGHRAIDFALDVLTQTSKNFFFFVPGNPFQPSLMFASDLSLPE